MSIKLGPEGVDFQGKRGVNASDAVHDKDVVVLRQLRRAIRTFSGLTGSTSIVSIGDGYPVYNGFNGSDHEFRSFSAITPNLYMLCGDTITYGLNDYLIITGITAFTGNYFELSATTFSAINIDAQYYFSAGTPLDFTFREKIWCASTGTEAVIRNNYTNNVATGNFSIIGGAYSYSNGNFSVIAGGSGNTSYGNYGVVVGGVANKQYGQYSFLGAGSYNIVSGNSSFLGAGFGNKTSKNFSVIVGGSGNYNDGVSSSILGGNFNSAQTPYSTILGGSTNLVSGNFSNINGGYRNKTYSIYSFIGNGLQNTIQSDSIFSSILNGENNLIRTGVTNSVILNGSANTINYNLNNVAVLGGHSLSALSSNTIYVDHAVARSLSGVGTEYVFVEADGHLIRGAVPIISFTGSGITSIINTGSTHGIWVGTYDTVAVLKSLSGGSNIIITSSSTENAIALSPDVGINSLYVSGNTILSSTTAMTMTVLNLSGGGTLMVVTDNDGNLNTQAIPTGSGGTGSTYYMVNTGSTHGIYAGMSGDTTFVLKSLSGGSNIIITSSSTENAIALSPDVVINSLSATSLSASTYYSGSTPLDFVFREKIWCGSTGTQAVIRNNYTNNVATGNFSIIGGAYSYSNGNFSAIAGGSGNTQNSHFGFIGSGKDNYSNGVYSNIIGGINNVSSGGSTYSFLGNGITNRIDANGGINFISSILNGNNNLIFGNAYHNSILGGSYNTGSSLSHGTTIGGYYQKNYGSAQSLIGVGYANKIEYSTSHSSILNGFLNVVSIPNSFTYTTINPPGSFIIEYSVISILNGIANTASTMFSTILNGKLNQSRGVNNLIGTGDRNVITFGYYNNIINGSQNYIFGRTPGAPLLGITDFYLDKKYNSTINGISNYMRSTNSSIINGKENKVYGKYNSLINGYRNILSILSSYGVILNGKNQTILSGATYSSILGGSSNIINYDLNNVAILGGANLTALSSDTTYADHVVARSLTSATVSYVFAESDGHLIIGSGPVVSSGTIVDAINTGSTHGIYAGLSGSSVLVFKSLSGGSNIIITSSSTENAIALSDDVVINSLSATSISATTFYSGSTPLSNYFQYLWTASTGTQAIIRNNGTYNLASGTHAWVSGKANTASTTYSFIAQGWQNKASGIHSFIGNGRSNSALTNVYSTILNGKSHTSSGIRSTVLNGLYNFATSTNSVVISGNYNSGKTSSFATVINGSTNLASGLYSIVGNGKSHTSSGTRSTVLNGLYNFATSTSSVVISGNYNSGKTSGFATVINGSTNLASGAYSFIGNGLNNVASNSTATILNGLVNTSSGIRSVVITGSGNTASSTYSSILNGKSNISQNTYATIINGLRNFASGSRSIIMQGIDNSGTSSYTVVVSGTRNRVAASKSSIINGTDNIIIGAGSTILNGTENQVSGGGSIILGGLQNSGLSIYSMITTGRKNLVANGWSSILGGSGNTIQSDLANGNVLDCNVIANGQNNRIGGIRYARRAFIGTGYANRILSNNHGTILNGSHNYISLSNGGFSQILNGTHNIIYHGTYLATPSHNTIVAGFHNFVGNSLTYSTGARINHCTVIAGRYNTGFTTYGIIGSGVQNWAKGNFAAIITGSGNTTNATRTFIGNGQLNSATGTYSSIVNGLRNYVNATHSFISNGTDLGLSSAASRSAIIGGRNYTGATADMVYVPEMTVWELTTSTINPDFISVDTDGRLYRTDIASLGTLIGSTSSISGITNVGGTHGVWRQTVSNIAQFKSLSGGSNIIITSSSTENAIALSDNVVINSLSATSISATTFYSGSTELSLLFGSGSGNQTYVQSGVNIYTGGTALSPTINLESDVEINSLNVSGTTILSSTTAMTMTVLNLSGGGTLMVVTDNSGNLSTQTIPTGSGALSNASNTGSTHGIYAGLSGSSVLVFKSLSGGSNIIITSSSTENAIALSDDVVISSLSATSLSALTLYSGSTPLSTIITNNIYDGYRASAVTYSDFTGTPKKATIVFANSFPDTNFAINITGDEERSWTFENKTVSGFIINSNSNISLTGITNWIAQKYYI